MTDYEPSGNWLSVEQTAVELGVSDKTVLLWVSEGVLPCLRYGKGMIRIPKDRLSDAAMRNVREVEEVEYDHERAITEMRMIRDGRPRGRRAE